MKRKSATNAKRILDGSQKGDFCQTPGYALDPLLPYLNKSWRIWESARGEGQIVNKLTNEGYDIVGTDILTGDNFFESEPKSWDCQVTNPPYSIKYDWIKRSYELCRPFALLMPLETLGAAKGQTLFKEHGMEIILLNRRVNFNMPNKGYAGTAQYPTAWFTWGLEIGQQLTYGNITHYPDEQTKLPIRDMLFENVRQCNEQLEFSLEREVL